MGEGMGDQVEGSSEESVGEGMGDQVEGSSEESVGEGMGDQVERQTVAAARAGAGRPEASAAARVPGSGRRGAFDRDSGRNARRRIFAEWRDAGLGTPFLPQMFESEVRRLGDWSWGCVLGGPKEESPGDPMGAYMQHPEVARFRTGDWRPRYHLSHAGHGVNSYSINYSIVTRRLAVFAQVGFGGVYMDSARSVAEVQDLGTDLRRLFAAAEAVQDWPQGRLLVTHSSFRGSAEPVWVAGTDTDPDVREGHGRPVRDGIAAAERVVTALRRLERVGVPFLRPG